MKIKQSLRFKVILVYILLAIINISLFSTMVYENQIDLIKENTQFQASQQTNQISAALKKAVADMEKGIFKAKNQEDVLAQIKNLISKSVPRFAIFKESGQIIYQQGKNFTLKNTDILAALKAITGKEFSGTFYHSRVDAKKSLISFYIPIQLPFLKDSILLFQYPMDEMNSALSGLYQLILFFVIAITVLHILFGLFIYRLVLRPVKELHIKSTAIQEGKLEERAVVNQNDELGALANAFNGMAESIQSKITTLQRKDEIMQFELTMANKIQDIIYPEEKNYPEFSYSVFHRALEQVSGDYHDIFPLSDNRYGFLVLDVSGHGVPAALITMIAKEKFSRYSSQYTSPSELFRLMNNEMSDLLEGYSAYFTAFYAILDQDKKLTFCNGGHQKPLLVKPENKKLTQLETNGCLVGMIKEASNMYENKTIQLEPGDKLLLFSDGIIEAANDEGEQFGEQRFKDSAVEHSHLAPKEMVKSCLTSLEDFAPLETVKDDTTLFIIEIN